MPNLYELVQYGQSSKFVNKTGDEYLVYVTTYSLFDPDGDEGDYVDVYMLGFNCILSEPGKRRRFDAKTRDTILSVFDKFMNENPDDAYVFVCDNKDGRARNRRITFGRWFNDADIADTYDRYHATMKLNGNSLYSSLIVRNNNPNKDYFLSAFRYTIRKTMGDHSDTE